MAKTKAITRYRYRRRKNPGRRRGGFTLPLAVIGGLVPAGVDVLAAFKIGGAQTALEHVSLCTTGYDPADNVWKPDFAARKLYGPLLLGTIVHKLASKLGINRMIARSGIPVVRI